MIKLIAVDMDGTFLNSQQDYDRKRFAKVHARMHALGIRFVVASGNQYYQLRTFFSDYPDTIYVAENGAYVRDAKTIYAEHTFSPEVTARITQFLSADPALASIACGVKTAHIRQSEDPAFITDMRRYYERLQLQATLEAPDDKIMKFATKMAPVRTQEYLDKFNEAFAGIAVPTSSGHGDIDIIQPGRAGQCTAHSAERYGGVWRWRQRPGDAAGSRPRRGDDKCPASGFGRCRCGDAGI